MTENRKKAALTAGAISLAAVLMLGGASIAWLQDYTDPYVNEFATNGVAVFLDETTGIDYNVVPGTSEVKDPTVTATYTLDSYVYVVVYDNTQDLVTYSIDSSWTLLTDSEGEAITYNGGTVYYQELTYTGTDNEEQSFSDTVIEGSVVSYSSSLTNEDMANASDVSLSFEAFIMQATIATNVKASAAGAWLIMINSSSDEEGEDTVLPTGYSINEETGEVYDDFESAIDAIEEGETLLLLSDVDLTSYSAETYQTIYLAEDSTLDLNGNTIYTYNGSVAYEGEDFTICNGSFDANGGSYGLCVGNGYGTANCVIEDVTVYGGINVYAAEGVTLRNCTVEATKYYAVWADQGVYDNALGLNTGYGVRIESGSYTSSGAAVLGATQYEGIASTIEVVGGTFTTTNATPKLFNSTGGELTVKGGIYNIDPTSYLAEGYEAISDASAGTWTVQEN